MLAPKNPNKCHGPIGASGDNKNKPILKITANNILPKNVCASSVSLRRTCKAKTALNITDRAIAICGGLQMTNGLDKFSTPNIRCRSKRKSNANSPIYSPTSQTSVQRVLSSIKACPKRKHLPSVQQFIPLSRQSDDNLVFPPIFPNDALPPTKPPPISMYHLPRYSPNHCRTPR